MKVLISGGTGFVGKKLINKLHMNGYEIIVLTRDESNARKILGKELKIINWEEFNNPDILKKNFEAIDVVINLAGESIGNGRWTKLKKEKIVNSRINSTGKIVEAIEKQIIKPKVLINASAIGYYGPHKDEIITEVSSPGSDFLAKVGVVWEKEAAKAEKFGVRTVLLRIGIVLGKDGALKQMVIPYKFFLGGTIGNGNQWFSWIHIDDLTDIIRFTIENNKITGPINATAPNPLTMKEFNKILGKVLDRPSWLPVSSVMLKLVLGEMAGMLINGQRVIPQKLLDLDYEFKYPIINEALENALNIK